MASVDIKIDQDTRDIVIVNGELQLVTGAEAVAQRIWDVLHTFAGEWFADLTYGIPYKRDIMIKDPQLPIVTEILKENILDEAGEGSRFGRFDLLFDSTARVLDLQADVLIPGEDGPTDISQPVGN